MFLVVKCPSFGIYIILEVCRILAMPCFINFIHHELYTVKEPFSPFQGKQFSWERRAKKVPLFRCLDILIWKIYETMHRMYARPLCAESIITVSSNPILELEMHLCVFYGTCVKFQLL